MVEAYKNNDFYRYRTGMFTPLATVPYSNFAPVIEHEYGIRLPEQPTTDPFYSAKEKEADSIFRMDSIKIPDGNGAYDLKIKSFDARAPFTRYTYQAIKKLESLQYRYAYATKTRWATMGAVALAGLVFAYSGWKIGKAAIKGYKKFLLQVQINLLKNQLAILDQKITALSS
jgi:hypothetical protein